ncbi:MAG: DUF2179 domain-containing protein [Candidatus Omnitrophota bacterium]
MFQWVILPLLIFSARILDVSLDTVRILLIGRGKKNIAPLLGFIQVIIWLLAIRQIFLHLSNPVCFIAYAAGFATGTWVGMLLEERLAIGVEVIRIITRNEASRLIEFLRQKNYRVTKVSGQGVTGEVNIVYTIVKRRDTSEVVDIVKRFNPKAFYTIEDIRAVTETFPQESVSYRRLFKRNTPLRG